LAPTYTASPRSGQACADTTTAVAALAERLAEELGLPADEIERIRHVAELHDVGRVAIPDEILASPARSPTTNGRSCANTPSSASASCSPPPALAPVAALVRSSDERFDGTGYRNALPGEQIPLGARIIAACEPTTP
jgi:two-component system, cell cycle response regulator